MTDEMDRFKAAWRTRSVTGADNRPKEEIMVEIKQRVEKLDRTVFWRDARETLAAVCVSGFFAVTLLWITNPMSRVGAWVLILSGVAITATLHITRLRRRHIAAGEGLETFCRLELEKVDAQIRLLRGVTWWYVAPVLVGVNLFYFGLSRAPMSGAVYLALSLVIGAGIIWLNQRAVRRELQPLRDELQGCLDGLYADPDV